MTTTYAERCAIERERLASLSETERQINADSHIFGRIDDCIRCLNCEIGSWNAWHRHC